MVRFIASLIRRWASAGPVGDLPRNGDLKAALGCVAPSEYATRRWEISERKEPSRLVIIIRKNYTDLGGVPLRRQQPRKHGHAQVCGMPQVRESGKPNSVSFAPRDVDGAIIYLG